MCDDAVFRVLGWQVTERCECLFVVEVNHHLLRVAEEDVEVG